MRFLRRFRPAPAPGAESVPVRNCREVVNLLKRWEDGVPLNELLSGMQGRSLLVNVSMTLFRHLGTIDFLCDHLAVKSIRRKTRPVLRWGTCQLLYLAGLPPPLVVNTAVTYARERISKAQSNFVNALLRRVAHLYENGALDPILAQRPEWARLEMGSQLYRTWRKRFAPDQLAELSGLLAEPAPVVVRRRPGATALTDTGLRHLPEFEFAHGQEFFVCTEPARLFTSAAFRQGSFSVQDPSTAMAPCLLDAQPGECVGDLCAAPGGKARMLAEAVGPKGRIICADRSRKRLRLVEENLERLPQARMLTADIAHPPFCGQPFDAVLLDVPCTNTGVIRRRPDVRWRYRRKTLRELVELQARILRGAANLVRPGGRLCYSTCSLEPPENTDQVRAFLAERPDFELRTEHDLLPCCDHDGAYAALLVRRAAAPNR